MILSGVAAQALELEKGQIQQQLNGVSDILGTAQMIYASAPYIFVLQNWKEKVW